VKREYISPDNPNMTPDQIRDMQDALRNLGSKAIVLPPRSKVTGMSKQSRKKARRRHAHRKSVAISTICQQCGRVGDGSVASLLTNVTNALNACADSGLKVRNKHGIFMVDGQIGGGYVLPLPDGRWTARTVTYDPFLPGDPRPDDLDD